MNDYIAIVIPVYNVKEYLPRCIESVLGQTYTKFTAYLIDDGSTDGSSEICDKYASEYPNIEVIHQENSGLSAARNKGIDIVLSSGKYDWITFIDSDDWIHKNYLEYLYSAAVKFGQKVSICNHIQVEKYCKDKEEQADYSVYKTDVFYMTNHVRSVVACAKLYHVDLFDDVRYPIGRIHEDEFTTYKLLFKCSRVAYVKNNLYFYYYNSESITRKKWSLQRLDALDAVEERKAYFHNRQMPELEKYTERQYEYLKAKNSVLAIKNHCYYKIPKEKRYGFFKAASIMESFLGRDDYEQIMYDIFPDYVVLQAYIKKLISIFR